MSMIRKISTLFAAMAVAGALSVAHAQAGDPVLQQARAQGVVGEMATGYLGVADESKATPDVKRRVEETNAKRLSLYTQLSKQSGETVANVAGVTAEKQISRASSGEMIKLASGSWTKKP
ncbi:MAG: YdbL family protein [Alphaproteobacteria bacterium]